MSKPQPRRVPSDDCAVTVGGEVYYPHKGEWIEVVGGMKVGEIHALGQLGRLQVQMDAVKGEPGEMVATAGLMDTYFSSLGESLARRLVAWNWTDDAGRPLPQPNGNLDVLRQISAEEVLYLMTAVQGETPGERGNGLRALRTTSSATASAATVTARSTTARSRQKRS